MSRGMNLRDPVGAGISKREKEHYFSKNGFITEQGKRKQGYTNGRGITNGFIYGGGPNTPSSSGFINGFCSAYTRGNGQPKQSDPNKIKIIRRRARKRTALGITLLLILLFGPVLTILTSIPTPPTIIIDGKFRDWQGIPEYREDEKGPTPSLTLDSWSVTKERDFGYIKVRTKGEIFKGGQKGGKQYLDRLSILIDEDKDKNTGYFAGNLGADSMIRVEGREGKIKESTMWMFSSQDKTDVNGFIPLGPVKAEKSQSGVEIQFPLQSREFKASISLNGIGGKDGSCITASPGKTALIVSEESIPSTIPCGGMEPVTSVSLTAKGSEALITDLELVPTGTIGGSEIDEVMFIAVAKDQPFSIRVAQDNKDEYRINFDPPVTAIKDLPLKFYASVKIGANARPGRSVGLRVTRVLSDAVVTLDSDISGPPAPASYVESPGTCVVIDGAFEDWKDISEVADGRDRYPNIDLTLLKTHSTNSSVYACAEVRGNILTGTTIPVPEDSLIFLETKNIESVPSTSGESLPPEALIGKDELHVYIDVDREKKTGHSPPWLDLGAEYLVAVEGRFGRIIRSQLFCYEPGKWDKQWPWSKIEDVRAANNKSAIEMDIPWEEMGINPRTVDLVFAARNWMGNEDLSPLIHEDYNPTNTRQYIRLKVGTFDPLEGELELDEELKTDEGQGYYLVQFIGPVEDEWKDEITTMEGGFYGYIPDFTYILNIEDNKASLIRNLSFVRWSGIYQPRYKIDPRLKNESQSKDRNKEINITLTVFNNVGRVDFEIDKLGGIITSKTPSMMDVKIKFNMLPDIAGIPEVEWIQKKAIYKITNDIADDPGRMNVSPIWEAPYNLDGTGQIVAVCDTGLDTGVNDASMHDDFEGNIVAIYSWPDTSGYSPEPDNDDGASDLDSGHGTHVAGSVLGDGTMSSGDIKGMAPGASLVFQAVEQYLGSPYNNYYLTGIPNDLNALFQQAYDDGARVHTNSWGSDLDGEYTMDSQNTDEFVWKNRDMVIFFSAGNEAVDGNSNGIADYDSLNSPGTAKNCITIGATENLRGTGGIATDTWGTYWDTEFPVDPINSDLTSDNSQGMAPFSSRGPCDDGRLKPDLVAPGTNVLSTKSSVATGGLWGDYNDYYWYSGGTSMATPLSAGAAALVRRFYVREESHSPTAALVKATLINGATDIDGQYSDPYNDAGPIPNNDEGWGMINIMNSLYPTSPREVKYEDITSGFTASSQTDSYIYNLKSDEPLKITLVWNDYEGTLSSGGLVNDLDLKVTTPGGSTYYYGNDFANGWSDTSHTYDRTNNVECVYIQTPATGKYTVEVNSYNIGNLGMMPDQEYALVVSGHFGADNDVGVEQLDVNSTQENNSKARIKAAIKNYGNNDQSSPFNVRCKINDPDSTEVYNNVKQVSSLASLATTDLTWHYTPVKVGMHTVIVQTELTGDDETSNDAATRYMMVPLILEEVATITDGTGNELFGYNVSSGKLNNDAYSDIVVGAPGNDKCYVFYGPVSGDISASSADVTLSGGGNTDFGWDVGVADVTGDGLDDVLVGAPGYNSDQGRVYIYHASGTRRGLGDATADVTITGASTGDRFGFSVSGAGDVNNADNEDIIIGAYLNDNNGMTDNGQAYLYYGDGSISTTAVMADAILNGSSNNGWFGFSVSSAGDMDNDNVDDVIIGAPGADKAYIYYGGDTIGTSKILTIQPENDGTEACDNVLVSGSPNANCGTLTDLYVGYYNENTWKIQRSILKFDISGVPTGTRVIDASLQLYKYHCSDNTIDIDAHRITQNWTESSSTWNTYDGTNPWSSAGGDYDSTVIDTTTVDTTTGVWDAWNITTLARDWNEGIYSNYGVLLKSVDEEAPSNDKWYRSSDYSTHTSLRPKLVISYLGPDITLTGENTGNYFGWSVNSSGNVNGDSYDDVIVGAPGYSSNAGRSYLFNGGSSLPTAINAVNADLTVSSGKQGDRFGSSVSSAGDVNSDGYHDILVGAPYNDTIDGSKSDAGAVYIFYGGSSLPSNAAGADAARYGETANDHFGWSVSHAGDTDYDSYDDIIVGAPHFDTGAQTDAGKAYLLSEIPEFSDYIPVFMTIPLLALILWKRKKRKN